MARKERRPDQLGEPKQGANIIDLEYYKGNENNCYYLNDFEAKISPTLILERKDNHIRGMKSVFHALCWDCSMTIRELCEMTGLNYDTVSRHLFKLISFGIAKRSEKRSVCSISGRLSYHYSIQDKRHWKYNSKSLSHGK